MPNPTSTADLPRPFYSEWSRSESSSAKALWEWHSALARPLPVGGDGTVSSVEAYFADEYERARNAEPLRTVRESVWRPAYQAVERHDLDPELLAAQVRASRHLQGSVRFLTASELEDFARQWAIPHARLLASLAGIDYGWMVKRVDELARGFFFLARFLTLPHDVKQGQLFIPVTDLKQNDVQLSELRDGDVNEGVRRVLWKHSIRIRDAFGQGEPILKDLGLRRRLTLKRWWYGSLEVLNEIERRDFDVWSEPIQLSAYRKIQVYLLTVFGQSTTA